MRKQMKNNKIMRKPSQSKGYSNSGTKTFPIKSLQPSELSTVGLCQKQTKHLIKIDIETPKQYIYISLHTLFQSRVPPKLTATRERERLRVSEP